MVSDFAEELRRLLPQPCPDRPFECEGLPQECDVMLIGENPANDIGKDWWLHWRNDTEGRDRKAAEASFRDSMAALGRREGPTHRRVNKLRCRLCIGGARLLVTNVYRNGRQNGAGPGICNKKIIQLLFENMPRLAFIIVHGTEAMDGLRRQGVALPVASKYTNHFSARGVSDADIERLADEALCAVAEALRRSGELLATGPCPPPRCAT